MKFQAVIQLSGKTATGIQVPEEVITALGSGKKPPVSVTIRGYTYRTTIGSMGGKYMIPVSAEHRAGSGVSAGDEVEVEVRLDTEVRELAMPEDLKNALEENAEAKRYFEGLSYSNKRRFTIPIEEAKSAETRQRRIEKTVNMLSEGRIQ